MKELWIINGTNEYDFSTIVSFIMRTFTIHPFVSLIRMFAAFANNRARIRTLSAQY